MKVVFLFPFLVWNEMTNQVWCQLSELTELTLHIWTTAQLRNSPKSHKYTQPHYCPMKISCSISVPRFSALTSTEPPTPAPFKRRALRNNNSQCPSRVVLGEKTGSAGPSLFASFLSKLWPEFVDCAHKRYNSEPLNFWIADSKTFMGRAMQSSDINLAARELEELRRLEQDEWLEDKLNRTPIKHRHRRFPPSCLNLLRSIDGNLRCVDCDATNPQWATISYGALLCIDCSGRHRQLGVQVGFHTCSVVFWSHHFRKTHELLSESMKSHLLFLTGIHSSVNKHG